MARTPGIRFIHIVYSPLEGEVKHDLHCGNECTCEPKSVRIGKDTILVVHDPKGTLFLIDDDARPTKPPADDKDNPFRSR